MQTSELSDSNLKNMWNQALDYWGTSIQISNPIDLAEVEKTNSESIAYIDLKSRQVVYNKKWFEKHKIVSALPAAFAHELGHHVKFPATLKTSAELILLAENFIPGLPFYHLNIFWDLLVNEYVGRDVNFREQLKQIYFAVGRNTNSEYYKRYLAVYEYIWQCEGHFQLHLDTNAVAYSASFANTFYQLPNLYEQFLYFLSHFISVFSLDDLLEQPKFSDPFADDSGAPGADDFPVDGKLSNSAKKAIDKAREKKWIKKGSDEAEKSSTWKNISNVISRLPGKGKNNTLQKASIRFYKNEINKLISTLPKQIKAIEPEKTIFSVHDVWETGDDVNSIDWTGSYIKAGALAPAFLLKRELIADDLSEQISDFKPKIEIFLDTSGSMPSPLTDINAMTLAALLLATYAIRKSGAARGSVYSSESIESDWMSSETRAQEFFLNYFGSGTEFPFAKLKQFTEDSPKCHRVIISDGDFIYNVTNNAARAIPILESTLANSLSLTFLLHQVSISTFSAAVKSTVAKHKNCRFIEVKNLDDFAPVASSLARALFGDLT